MHTKFSSESLKVEDHSEDLGIDGIIILVWIKESRCKGVDWIHLAQNRELLGTRQSAFWVRNSLAS
jgi:hypothetical protein